MSHVPDSALHFSCRLCSPGVLAAFLRLMRQLDLAVASERSSAYFSQVSLWHIAAAAAGCVPPVYYLHSPVYTPAGPRCV